MKRILFILLLLAILAAIGCQRKMYDPAWATRPYPRPASKQIQPPSPPALAPPALAPPALAPPAMVDMQVFRRGESIKIVNSTARSYSNFDVWVNQRYVHHVDSMPAGATIKLSLWNFHDEYGDAFNAGGFFRTYSPTPVRLVEIQPGEDQALLGLVAIRREEIRAKPEPGR